MVAVERCLASSLKADCISTRDLYYTIIVTNLLHFIIIVFDLFFGTHPLLVRYFFLEEVDISPNNAS